MRILAALFATAVLGASGTACTLYVLRNLSDTDNLGVDAAGPPDPCTLVPTSEANACSTCITNQCHDDVQIACTGADGGKEEWWDELAACAEGPYLGYGPPSGRPYSCGEFDPDGGPSPGNDDVAKKRQLELCVRDKCIRPSNPPCKQCPVDVDLPDNVQGTAPLDGNDPCGKCLAAKCNDALVTCCSYYLVDEALKYCGYTSSDEYKAKCAALGGDAEASNASQPCEQKLRACYAQCKGTCP
jgi:hypothetical protein